MTQMQGIVSILKSDNPEKMIKAGSLRRTLSADMSSKKCLAENESPLMKKIESSEQISIDSSSSSELDEEECDMKGKGDEHPRRIDIWTAIMSQKKQDNSGRLPPPYLHPLVKKSASLLSEKSLKVCTESLGSETGSDVSLGSETRSYVFSSHLSSETGEEQQEEKEEHKVVKLACLTTKKAHRSFPPPLPSLATAHTDGPSLHMHSRRVDGRLVLEAVSVPQQKYFEAQRQDGRFLLNLINNPEDQPTENEFFDVFNLSEEENSLEYDNNNNKIKENNDSNENDEEDEEEYEDEDEEEDEDRDEDEDEYEDEIGKDLGILKEQPLNTSGIVINEHRSTVTIKKMTERDNENPWWSRKLNTKVSNYLSKLDVVEEKEAPITKSLPPRPRVTGLPPLPPPPSAANSVNKYQYFWSAKPTVASVIDQMITQHRPPTKTKDLVLLRGNKADCSFRPSLKGCKEPRRTLEMWEPFCIATS